MAYQDEYDTMERNVRINREHLGGSLDQLKQCLMKEPVFRLGLRLYDMAEEIGRAVTQMRLRAHLTQQDVADQLGVRQSLVARLESKNPDRMPTFATVARVADVCGYQMEIVLRPKSDNNNEDRVNSRLPLPRIMITQRIRDYDQSGSARVDVTNEILSAESSKSPPDQQELLRRIAYAKGSIQEALGMAGNQEEAGIRYGYSICEALTRALKMLDTGEL